MIPENTRKYAKNLQHEAILRQNRLGYPTREVPVDVHMNAEHNARTIPSNYHHPYVPHQQSYNHTSHIRVPSTGLPYLEQPQYYIHQHADAAPTTMQPERCWRCGLLGPCTCIRSNDNLGVQSSVYISHPGEDNYIVKNAVQLARNRKKESGFMADSLNSANLNCDTHELSANANQEHCAPDPYDLYRPIIIELDCAGSTVLGITVEASQSLNSQRKSKSNSNSIDLDAHITTDHNIERVPRGLQITNIQDSSVIDRNGNFKIGDIIVEVNGVNLQRRTFQEAQDILRKFVLNNSSQNVLLLRILRKSSNITSSKPVANRSLVNGNIDQHSNSPSPKNTTPKNITSPSSSGARHLAESFNTRKIGRKHCIQLRKSRDSGFGIKIAERDNSLGTKGPIYITAITTTGAAYRDGRLKEGDMLLEINHTDLTDKTQSDVTRMLREVNVNELVEFVVSRQESPDEEDSIDNRQPIEQTASANDCDNERSLIDFESPNRYDRELEEQDSTVVQERPRTLDGPGIYVYDIPINDTKSAGLGLYLKYPKMARKDLGIYIEKVITGGAAWKDGRLQPDDQILAINGLNLMGLSNADAAETLTAAVCKGIGPETTSSMIRLNIHRRMVPVGLIKAADDHDIERPQSARSWDEDSVDVRSGEERFRRDGFGRQSISEKKHAQLNAKNTDTYKRNQKLREERERQRLASLQLEEKPKETNRPKSFNLDSYLRHQSTSVNQIRDNGDSQLTSQIDQLRDDYNLNLRNCTLSYPTREVPVDVHVDSEQDARLPSSNYNDPHIAYNQQSHIRVPSSGLPYLDQPQYWMHPDASASNQPVRCWRCGLLGPCACIRANNMGVQSSMYISQPGQDGLVVKSAVRLARNRKVNASFRAAVDRSYG